nr:CrcB family protein [Methylobacillus glycogenes]
MIRINFAAGSTAQISLGYFHCQYSGLPGNWSAGRISERSGSFSTEWRLFLFTGLLGGFTTFSAFGLETMMLVKQGEWVIALSYISLSIIVGLALLFAGYYLLK